MEEKNQQNQYVQEKVGRRYKKIMMVVAAIIILFLVFVGLRIYQQWQMKQKVDKLTQALKQLEQKDYQHAMADTYGGKTPQETLQMYINAVEKGDFELASKYFIDGKQENELIKLREIKQKNNIDFLLNYLIQAKKAQGYFSTTSNLYTVEKPIFVEFKLYPNGIWKIMEL